MSPDRFHAELGPPEDQPAAGMAYTFVQKAVRIAATAGFRDLGLDQLDGVLLALDWVAEDTHHVWGSAVMVAPGVAVTARHVVDEMRAKGFLAAKGGQLFAVGFHAGGRVELWRADSFTSVDVGDLSLLTLIRSTGPSEASAAPTQVGLAKMAARMPHVGEGVSLVGFRAAELAFAGHALMGLTLVGSVGAVIDLYPAQRDAHGLPNPSAAIDARTVNGMSGGAAFDAEGRLVGIISSGLETDTSFISLTWPATYVPIAPKWPPGLSQAETTLGALAREGLAGIDHLDDVETWIDGDGRQMVSISDPNG